MKYDEYTWNGDELEDFFEVLKKLGFIDHVDIRADYDDERIEAGCRCGRCFDIPAYYLDIHIKHGDIDYEDERDTE